MSEFLHIDLIALIQALGYLGLFAIVFAESGLFSVSFFRETACCLLPDCLPRKDFSMCGCSCRLS